jgi:hypothetical protein
LEITHPVERVAQRAVERIKVAEIQIFQGIKAERGAARNCTLKWQKTITQPDI